MDKLKIFFIYFFLGLSYFFVHGQQIGNYVANGSFESVYTCTSQLSSLKLKNWSCIDSSKICADMMHTCWGNVPVNGVGYQYPKHGGAYMRLTLWCPFCGPPFTRSNLKNRLKQNLIAGITYCVRMYVTVQDMCPNAIDGFGFYFGDNSIDTIIYNARLPLTFLTPQVSNPVGNIILDSMNWVPITGTFTANGTEKYLIISNFKSDIATNTVLTGYMPANGWAEYFVDAVSCIEVNLPAYAGPDKLIYPGDSVYIGREKDYAIDPGCIWYKLPNMATAIDTISGLWVKPSVTSTYVVRQELDCSSVKWDTVVVIINNNLVGLGKLQSIADNISLFPNPTSGNLSISFSGSVSYRHHKVWHH